MKTVCFKIISILFIVVSCDNNDSTGKKEISQSELKEPLIQVNRSMAERESSLIDHYIERRKLKMQTSGTGLRYYIYVKGSGEQARDGKIARVSYTISLLNGTVCYQTKDGESKDFLIGKDNVESGIHEGITYMKVGDKAKLIIPSHLAHGLTGDLNKIPPQSTLVVDIELLALN